MSSWQIQHEHVLHMEEQVDMFGYMKDALFYNDSGFASML